MHEPSYAIISGITITLCIPCSVQELTQQKEELAAELDRTREEVVEFRKKVHDLHQGQKKAEADRDEAEMRVIQVSICM